MRCSFGEMRAQFRQTALTLLKVNPRWDSCCSNLQFAAIFKRIGLQ